MVQLMVMLVGSAAVATAPAATAGEWADLPAPRLAGRDRVATSIVVHGVQVDRLSGPADGAAPADLVVAEADHPLVALAAAGLAGLRGAPLLLAGEPPAEAVLRAIADQDPAHVLVVGDLPGLAAVMEQEGRATVTVAPEGGPPAVAAALARQLDRELAAVDQPPRRTAYLVSTAGVADAVAVSPLAAEEGAPVLLTAPDRLDPHTDFVLRHSAIDRVVIIGGTTAVAETVAEEVAAHDVVVERLAGATRQGTALAVTARRGVTLDHVLLGDGPDAAGAGPLAARSGAALLPPGDEVIDQLAARCASGVVLQVLGGAGAVDRRTEGRHRAAVERCHGPASPVRLALAAAGPDDVDVASVVATAAADPRGWGSRRVALSLASTTPDLGVIVADDGCGGATLCRRGHDVVIDADAWRASDPAARLRMVNLLIGHRLGQSLADSCDGSVMQPLECGTGDPWPSDDARTAAAEALIPSATLAFGGDVHGERHIGRRVIAGDNPLGAIAPVLQAADLAIVNLETPLSNRGAPVPKTFTFRGPPEMAADLVEAGVDVATLANNHGLDFGVTAMLDTLDHAAAAGLGLVGAGPDATSAYAPEVVQTPAGTVAVVGLTRVLHTRTWEATATRPGLASAYDEAAAVRAVRAADEQADHVVVAIHWGTERADCPDPAQRHLGRLLVDAGADVVVGHHPHVLQGVQVLDGALVAYSTGNFVWYHDRAPSRFSGVLQVQLPSLDMPEWSFAPAVIGGDGSPRLVEGPAGAAIMQRLVDRSPGGAAGCRFAR